MNVKMMLVGGAALAVSACSNSSTHSESRAIGSTQAMITTADLRLVTERQMPLLDNDGKQYGTYPVLCTEPSPDVAKALSTLSTGQGAISLSLPIAGAVVNEGASAAGSRGTAEQLAQLTERMPSVQALRDGLYRACEAYANRAIGRNAYALILSRYGELLTTLLLAEAAAGSYGHQLALLQGVPLNAFPNAPAVPAPGAKPSAAADPKTDVAVMVATEASRAAGGASPVSPQVPRPGSTPITGAGIAAAIGNNVPAALENMHFNYLRLNHITPMLVLCANNQDTTIAGPRNAWPGDTACNTFIAQVVANELAARNQADGATAATSRRTSPGHAPRGRAGG